jgi:hypothetical protein
MLDRIFIRYQIAKQQPLVWISLLFVGAATATTFIWPGPVIDGNPTDFRIRAIAAIMQISGAWLVWRDLSQTARAFNREAVIVQLFDWIGHLIRPRRVANLSTALTGSASISIGVFGRGKIVLPPNASPEERLRFVERQLNELDDVVAGMHMKLEEAKRELVTKIDETSRKHANAHAELSKKVENSIVGNYPELWFGAAWAIVGTVLSALSQDIARGTAMGWSIAWKYM